MTQDIQMLNQIRQTTQMGQVGIRAVRKYTPTSAFDNAMQTQYVEYDRICKDADKLLAKHCGTPKNLSPLAKAGAAMSARFIARTDEKGSQIAKMMIEGNTKGMIKSLHGLHSLQPKDKQVTALAERLLQTEIDNIESMKRYL